MGRPLFWGALFAWLVVLLAAPLITLPIWSLPLARHLTAPFLEDLDFKVESMTFSHLTLSELRVAQTGQLLELDRITLRFDAFELIRGQIRSIGVSGVRWEMDLNFNGAAAQPRPESIDTAVSVDPAVWLLPLYVLLAPPFEELWVDGLEWSPHLAGEAIPSWSGYVNLFKSGRDWSVTGSMEQQGHQLGLVASLHPEDPSALHLSLLAESRAPLELIHQYEVLWNADGNTGLPEDLNVGRWIAGLDYSAATSMWSVASHFEAIQWGEVAALADSSLSLTSNIDFTNINAKLASRFRFEQMDFFDLEFELLASDPLTSLPRFHGRLRVDPLEDVPPHALAEWLTPVELHFVGSEGTWSLEFDSMELAPVGLRLEKSSIAVTPDAGVFKVSGQGVWGMAESAPFVMKKTDRGPAGWKLEGRILPESGFPSGVDATGSVSIPHHSIEWVSDGLGRITGGVEVLLPFELTDEGAVVRLQASVMDAVWKQSDGSLFARGAVDLQLRGPAVDPTPESLVLDHAQINLNLSGSMGMVPYSVRGLEWGTVTDSVATLESGVLMEFRGARIDWDAWSLMDFEGTSRFSSSGLFISLEGKALQEDILLSASFEFDFDSGNQHGRAVVNSGPVLERRSLTLSRWLPDLPLTILGGLIELAVEFALEESEPSLLLNGFLREGTLTIPDDGIALRGIEVPSLVFSNLLKGEGPSGQSIRISDIAFGHAQITNLKVVFHPVSDFGVRIEQMEFEFCQGHFQVSFAQPLGAGREDFDFIVDFKGLELGELLRLFPDLRDEVSGRVRGRIPMRIAGGELSWGEGFARLMDGETGRMRYAEDGILGKYLPNIQISRDLNLSVNEALADVILSELSIAFRSSDRFDEPTTVIFSGRSNHPTLLIPIERVQLNLRATDAPWLINRALKDNKWIDSIIFGGKL